MIVKRINLSLTEDTAKIVERVRNEYGINMSKFFQYSLCQHLSQYLEDISRRRIGEIDQKITELEFQKKLIEVEFS